MVEPLYTIKETEAALRASRCKIYRLINSGAIQAVKVGGSRRVLARSVEEYIANQLVAGALNP